MATVEELTAELRKDLDGYASDTPFQAAFSSSGPNEDCSNIVFVDNLPVVPEDKLAKLCSFAREKVFSKLGEVAAEGGIHMPVDEEKKTTLGFAFVTYATPEQAAKAVAALDKFDFDKAHKLKVMRFDEFGALASGVKPRPSEPVELQAADDDGYWLLDEQCRDEFLLRFSNTEKDRGDEPEKHETEVLWANLRGPPALDYGGERQKASGKYWADRLVQWSPRGTYLTTMHKPGAKLWHGKGFRDGFRLEHAEVHEVLWSPDERYVCTWNGYPNNPHPERAFVVWDARTGVEVRKFKQAEQQDAHANFAWSADGKYLARIVTEVAPGGGAVELIHVYEAPHFRLLDDRSIKAPGARELSWCPRKHNLLAWWTPERDNAPTSVSIMRIPGKDFARQRQLFNVQDCKLVWHPQGDFGAVLAEKLTKGQMARKKKTGAAGVALKMPEAGVIGGPPKPTTSGFTIECFRFKSKDVPVDVLEVKDRVVQFAWEPHAPRFATLSGDGPAKFNVTFYGLGDRGISQLHVLENQPISALHWSPRGEIALMTGMGMQLGGYLHFYDVERKKSLSEQTHEVATGVAWDPSGRMVATVKTRPMGRDILTRDTVGNGYVLWTFQGSRVHSAEKPKLFQFAWRPRPEGLLSEDEAREVAKNLKKFVQRYQDEDKARLARKGLLARLRKRKARDEFRAFLEEREAEWEENRPMREALGLVPAGASDGAEAGDQVVREDVEVLLSETVTVVEGA